MNIGQNMTSLGTKLANVDVTEVLFPTEWIGQWGFPGPGPQSTIHYNEQK